MDFSTAILFITRGYLTSSHFPFCQVRQTFDRRKQRFLQMRNVAWARKNTGESYMSRVVRVVSILSWFLMIMSISYHISMGWLKEKSTGNHRFSHEDHGIFRVIFSLYFFPLNQCGDTPCISVQNWGFYSTSCKKKMDSWINPRRLVETSWIGRNIPEPCENQEMILQDI